MIIVFLFFVCGLHLAMTMISSSPSIAAELRQGSPPNEPVFTHVIRAPDWNGAVYATATHCGVPRQEADRVSIIRQPLPGISPIRASTQLPSGRYAVWVYGAGDADHLQIRLCAKTCVIGDLPATPGWVFLDWMELREQQTILLRSWQQPETHLLYVQAISLSSSDHSPDWIP
jgi:hypothetical protein